MQRGQNEAHRGIVSSARRVGTLKGIITCQACGSCMGTRCVLRCRYIGIHIIMYRGYVCQRTVCVNYVPYVTFVYPSDFLQHELMVWMIPFKLSVIRN